MGARDAVKTGAAAAKVSGAGKGCTASGALYAAINSSNSVSPAK